VEGLGIKRGLTPVEVGILMEQPMDKILTMILFSSMQKEAAEIARATRWKSKWKKACRRTCGSMRKSFLEAFKLKEARARTTALQEMMVNLVKKSVLRENERL
jgi:hypothetical protein